MSEEPKTIDYEEPWGDGLLRAKALRMHPLSDDQKDIVHRYLTSKGKGNSAVQYAVAMGGLKTDFNARDFIRCAHKQGWELSDEGRVKAREIGCLNSDVPVVRLCLHAQLMWKILSETKVGYRVPGKQLAAKIADCGSCTAPSSNQLSDAKKQLIEAGKPMGTRRGYYRTG